MPPRGFAPAIITHSLDFCVKPTYIARDVSIGARNAPKSKGRHHG